MDVDGPPRPHIPSCYDCSHWAMCRLRALTMTLATDPVIDGRTADRFRIQLSELLAAHCMEYCYQSE